MRYQSPYQGPVPSGTPLPSLPVKAAVTKQPKETHYGSGIAIVSLLVAFTIAFWPVDITVLGTSIGCGSAAVVAVRGYGENLGEDSLTQDVVHECTSVADERVVIGGLVISVAAVLGIGVGVSENRDLR